MSFLNLYDIKIKNDGLQTMYKYIHKNVIRLWKECVRQFIFAAMEEIHVDTGMSMASLYPLGTKVRIGNLIYAKSKGNGPKKDYNDGEAKYRSRALGKRLGKKAYKLSFGSPRTPKLSFYFVIVVFQYEENEPDWRSLDAGAKAFKDYWNSHAWLILDNEGLLTTLGI